VARPFTPRDIFLVKDLERQTQPLGLEGALLCPPAPLLVALLGHSLLLRKRFCTYVVDAGTEWRQFKGFVQMVGRNNGGEGEVICLAPALASSEEAPRIWRELLGHLILASARQGLWRLYAKVAEGDRLACEVLREVGFCAYAYENVFRLEQHPPDLPSRKGVPLGVPTKSSTSWGATPLRPQEAGDGEKLEGLYSSLTPRQVQQVEGSGRLSWGNTSPGGLWRGLHTRGFIWEEKGGITGYAHVVSSSNCHWLRLLLHPEAKGRAGELVQWSLALLPDRSLAPIYASVRGYESAIGPALEGSGFKFYAAQNLLVKNTAGLVRDGLKGRVPGLEKFLEAVRTASSMKLACGGWQREEPKLVSVERRLTR